ncbi:MAG: nucleotidyltransferase [Rhodothermia bacterium]|nr:nucleotidyltransferase [Rhodothermia bacterium]
MDKDFKEFIALLNENQVEYLIVGGYAVTIHGHPRFTGDLDIWVNATPENAHKVLKTVEAFGFSSYGLTIADFQNPDNVLQMGYPPFRIDVMGSISGNLNFEICRQNRKTLMIEDIPFHFIGFEDLLINKKASGRRKDLDDLENLA